MMMHLKAVRVFVESVLRYGLTPKATGMGAGPGPNFQSVLLQPKKGKEDHLHKALCSLYGGGSAINIDVRTASAPPTAPPPHRLRTAFCTPLPPLHLCRRMRRRCPARRASSTRTSSCRWTRRRQAWPKLACGLLAGPEQGQRRACGVLRGSSGQAGRRAAEGAGVVVLSCGRLREAGGRAWGAEGGWGYASNCALFIGEVEGGLRRASEF